MTYGTVCGVRSATNPLEIQIFIWKCRVYNTELFTYRFVHTRIRKHSALNKSPRKFKLLQLVQQFILSYSTCWTYIWWSVYKYLYCKGTIVYALFIYLLFTPLLSLILVDWWLSLLWRVEVPVPSSIICLVK